MEERAALAAEAGRPAFPDRSSHGSAGSLAAASARNAASSINGSIAASNSGRLRATSVSSRRRMKVPHRCRAQSQFEERGPDIANMQQPGRLGAKRTTGREAG
jgi:hypothetical protein